MNAALDSGGSPTTTGAMIDELVQIRDRKRELEAEIKDLNERWDALKAKVMSRMDEEGSNRVSSANGGTAILTESIVPQVVDRDEASEYILQQGALHLLQFRINTGAFREMVEAGQEVPGIMPFKKREISLRS